MTEEEKTILELTRACMAALRVVESYQREHHARTGDPFSLDGMDSGCSAPISHVLKSAVGLPVDDWDFQVAKPSKKPTLTDEERAALTLAWMNLSETARRGLKKGHSEEECEPLRAASHTIRKLLGRMEGNGQGGV